MLRLGYKLMAEEHAPRALLRNAVAAEAAGFDFTAISDHFSPWLEEQGHAGFAWSVLGAIAAATSRIGLMTAVTCPSFRYHPAIIAQAAATVALLSEDRFTLGLGAGERLNEHVCGGGWPGLGERHERLSEAIDIIQGLLSGEMRNFHGQHFRLDAARLFDRPMRKLPVVVAAGGPEAARLAGRKGDGIIATEAKPELLQAFGGTGNPCPHYAEVALCFGPSVEQAQRTAHRYSRWSLAGWPVMAELPDTQAFAAASAQTTPQQVGQQISCGPDPSVHLAAIRKYREAGFDHIILSQVGSEQDAFLQFFQRELAPALRG